MSEQPDSRTEHSFAAYRYWLAAGWAVIVVIAYALRQINLHASIVQSLLDTVR